MHLSVYLCGGMKTGWQKEVIQEVGASAFNFINPAEHMLRVSQEYTAWDLLAIKKADIVFAYMENTNPSGFGLSFEIGYALALNKTVIFVDEKSDQDVEFQRYTKIISNSCDVYFYSLKEGIHYLKSFQYI